MLVFVFSLNKANAQWRVTAVMVPSKALALFGYELCARKRQKRREVQVSMNPCPDMRQAINA